MPEPHKGQARGQIRAAENAGRGENRGERVEIRESFTVATPTPVRPPPGLRVPISAPDPRGQRTPLNNAMQTFMVATPTPVPPPLGVRTSTSALDPRCQGSPWNNPMSLGPQALGMSHLPGQLTQGQLGQLNQQGSEHARPAPYSFGSHSAVVFASMNSSTSDWQQVGQVAPAPPARGRQLKDGDLPTAEEVARQTVSTYDGTGPVTVNGSVTVNVRREWFEIKLDMPPRSPFLCDFIQFYYIDCVFTKGTTRTVRDCSIQSRVGQPGSDLVYGYMVSPVRRPDAVPDRWRIDNKYGSSGSRSVSPMWTSFADFIREVTPGGGSSVSLLDVPRAPFPTALLDYGDGTYDSLAIEQNFMSFVICAGKTVKRVRWKKVTTYLRSGMKAPYFDLGAVVIDDEDMTAEQKSLLGGK